GRKAEFSTPHLVQVRRPGRLANLALSGGDGGTNASVGGGQDQHTTTLLTSGVDYHSAIRGNSGRLVETGVGKDAYAVGHEVLRGDLEDGETVLPVHHHQGLLVRRQFRVGVVVAGEGDPLGVVGANALAIDLRLAGAVRGEVQGLPVLAPERLGVDRKVVGHTLHLPTGHVHHVDFRVAAARQHEGQAIAVRRPGRCAVEAFEVGHLLAAAGVDVLDEDARLALFEGHIGDAAAVRREARREDRLARLQQGHSAGAVVVGALQGVAGVVGAHALGGDVEDAGGGGTAGAGEVLEAPAG